MQGEVFEVSLVALPQIVLIAILFSQIVLVLCSLCVIREYQDINLLGQHKYLILLSKIVVFLQIVLWHMQCPNSHLSDR